MEDRTKNTWDVGLGIVSPVLTLVALLVGIWQFNEGENHRRDERVRTEAAAADMDFQRRLWLQRQDTYRQVSELVGEVIASRNTIGVQADRTYEKFLAAYWGAMILVEDPDVEFSMKMFYLELLDLKSGWVTDDKNLKARADQLVKACRTHLEKSAPRSRPTLPVAGKQNLMT